MCDIPTEFLLKYQIPEMLLRQGSLNRMWKELGELFFLDSSDNKTRTRTDNNNLTAKRKRRLKERRNRRSDCFAVCRLQEMQGGYSPTPLPRRPEDGKMKTKRRSKRFLSPVGRHRRVMQTTAAHHQEPDARARHPVRIPDMTLSR